VSAALESCAVQTGGPPSCATTGAAPHALAKEQFGIRRTLARQNSLESKGSNARLTSRLAHAPQLARVLLPLRAELADPGGTQLVLIQ